MSSNPAASMRVALDWTPNTLHTGLFLALKHGLYSKYNVDVKLTPPGPDYATTPAKLVRDGHADLCVCPSETIIAYAEGKNSDERESNSESHSNVKLQAIYAICQSDASAIAALADTASRPRDLGDKSLVYGTYNARYEDDIVRAMVTSDGGAADRMHIRGAPEVGKLELFPALLDKQGVDATWIFIPWEGVEAELKGTKLSTFSPTAHGVPYGYSPVIARNTSSASAVPASALKAFVQATQEGYALALRDSAAAVEVLKDECQPPKNEEFLKRSQEEINKFYGEKAQLGKMDEKRWQDWVSWLEGKGLVKEGKVKVSELWTNEFVS